MSTTCSYLSVTLVLTTRKTCAEGPTDPELEVHVAEDEMIVAQPGSAYAVTFCKLDGSPRLLAGNIAKRDNPSVEMTLISESLTRALREGK